MGCKTITPAGYLLTGNEQAGPPWSMFASRRPTEAAAIGTTGRKGGRPAGSASPGMKARQAAPPLHPASDVIPPCP